MELIINSELTQQIQDIDFAGSSVADSELVKAILLLAHPVGSYYWSSDATNPHDIFGGTWTQIKDKFIIAVGDSHTVGTDYGSNTKNISHTHSYSHTHGVPGVAHKHSTGNHTLTESEMPKHSHNMDDSTYGGYTNRLGIRGDGGGGTGLIPSFSQQTGWSIYKPQNTGSSGAHNHGNTGSATPSNTTTNSQSTSTSGSGGSTSLDITPACIAAYCWRRTA